MVCSVMHNFSLTTYLSIIIFILFLYRIYRKYPIFYIKYLLLLYPVFTSLISCVMIEFIDLNLIELQTKAFFVGSVPLLTLSYWVLFNTIISLDYDLRLNKNIKKSYNIDGCLCWMFLSLSIYILC